MYPMGIRSIASQCHFCDSDDSAFPFLLDANDAEQSLFSEGASTRHASQYDRNQAPVRSRIFRGGKSTHNGHSLSTRPDESFQEDR